MFARRPVAVAVLGGSVGLLVALALVMVSVDWPRPSPIAGDPTLYGRIAADVLAGGIPYVDVTVEHLPVLLIPIVGVGILAEATSIDYAALWPVVTITAVAATAALAGRVRFSEAYQRRFVAAMLPMLPLVVFRLEVYVVFIAVGAVAALSASRYRVASVWTLAGILAKGWPITLTGVPFRRGHRALALGTAAAGAVILLGVAALPGFQQGRSFAGIHSETIVGNLLLAYRHLTGSELDLVAAAGATYVAAPGVLVAVNALIGVAVVLIALRHLLRSASTVRLVSVAGLATAGIILTSPLFSAQFTFWLVPFVVLTGARTRTSYLVAAALSTMVAAFWNPSEAWWTVEVLVRNVAFVVLVVLWIRDLGAHIVDPGSEGSPVSEHVA